MQKQIQSIPKTFAYRVITMLDRREMDFLDRLGKDALFSTGRKLSYNEILKGLIDFAMEIGLSGEKIDSMYTLKEKLLREVKIRLQEIQEPKGKTNGD